MTYEDAEVGDHLTHNLHGRGQLVSKGQAYGIAKRFLIRVEATNRLRVANPKDWSKEETP